MLNLDKVTNIINKVIDKLKTPAETLPAALLICIAIKRPGLSASKIAAKAISNLEAIGIPTGPNTDGSPNQINRYTYNIVKCIVDGIKEDAVVQTVLPKGSVVVRVQGANAGGPIIAYGENVINSLAKGIVR